SGGKAKQDCQKPRPGAGHEAHRHHHGYALAVLIYELGKASGFLAGQIVGALLYMAVFGAVISYTMQCLSFILLRIKLPNIERPYRSLVGIPGAAIAGIIAVVALVSLYS